MERKLQGRVRYDKENDSFIYEICSYYVDEDGYEIDIEDESTEWGMCMATKCVRREGAKEGEDTNYIHFDFLKKIVMDAYAYGVELIWSGAMQSV